MFSTSARMMIPFDGNRTGFSDCRPEVQQQARLRADDPAAEARLGRQ
jgi:hypothetical protein